MTKDKADDDEPRMKPAVVRDLAKAIGCREILTQRNGRGGSDEDDPKVLSFMAGAEHDASNVARINIYYQTGTVGTCRILNGEVRETFRKRCSLETLEKILKEPPDLVSIGEKLVVMDDVYDDDGSTNPIHPDEDDENTIRKDIELADIGLAILMGEAEKLNSHAKSLRENDPDEVDAPPLPDLIGGAEDADGREYAYHLPAETISHIEDCLADSTRDPITCIATSGPGTVLLYKSGEWAYTSDIPKSLHRMLKYRKRSLPAPAYVSLGRRGRFYVSFRDGSSDWNGPNELNDCLKRHAMHKTVASVAFGKKKYTFFVVFTDGSWEYHGDIPDGLEEKLTERGDMADLICVTLGPSGEWFLKARNGRMWWGDVSEELDELMDELKEEGRIPCYVDFGEYGSYFVAHD